MVQITIPVSGTGRRRREVEVYQKRHASRMYVGIDHCTGIGRRCTIQALNLKSGRTGANCIHAFMHNHFWRSSSHYPHAYSQ